MLEILEDIGLSSNESKVYLSLLESGSSTVTNLASKAKIHRANTYDALNKLINRGLVAHIKKDNTTYYEAEDPHNLIRILKNKEQKLLDVMPQLLINKELSDSKSDASIHEGVPAFMNLLYNFLEKKQPLLIYGIPKIAPEILKTKIPHFHKERIKRKIRMDHIYNYDAIERINYLNKVLPYTRAKYLPEIIESQASTNICGDEVLITIWTKQPITVRIKNELIAKSYTHYFNVLWKNAKK